MQKHGIPSEMLEAMEHQIDRGPRQLLARLRASAGGPGLGARQLLRGLTSGLMCLRVRLTAIPGSMGLTGVMGRGRSLG